MLSSTLDLLVVVLGFGMIVFVHELGHFLAARWAGIRVLGFALGFGPALVSYRHGLGMRTGSSEAEYAALVRAGRGAGVSPTEYRLNALPFGGYVKMLGQDDADPAARSDEPDSFNNTPPWKRLIVISAGVVVNVVTAAVLFVVVFKAGLLTEAPMVGLVAPDSPASRAVATNAQSLGVTRPGLLPGDRILSVDGERVDEFKDVSLATAMSARGRSLRLEVERAGVAGVLNFEITPRLDPASKMLALGITPGFSGQIVTSTKPRVREELSKQLAEQKLRDLRPGMRVSSIDGAAPSGAALAYADLVRAIDSADGRPVRVRFEGDDAPAAELTLTPEPLAMVRSFQGDAKTPELPQAHVLGIVPVLKVNAPEKPEQSSSWKRASAAGLRDGDVFARLGEVEWPSMTEGILEIRRGGRTSIPVTVSRVEEGVTKLVDLGEVPVVDGAIGFIPGDTLLDSAVVSRWPRRESRDGAGAPSGAGLDVPPGSTIESVNGAPVKNLGEVRALLRKVPDAGAAVSLVVRTPDTASGPGAERTIAWSVPGEEIAQVRQAGWTTALHPSAFEPVRTTLRADSVVGAVKMGMRETHQAMLQTYLTLARLFQGTVRVEHLKGPVGIAHVGTQLADRGTIWMLFFFAAISVNLAVINFLPLPVVDGGHFLFILYEQLTGRPVNAAVQNAATLAGLALIGSMFLIVTYNDLVNVFR